MSAAHAAAYEQTRLRVAALAPHGPEAAVPATPGWCVQDVVAHLTGLAVDWVSGNLEAYASAGWTARQVDERSGQALTDVLAEWESVAGALGAIVAEPGAAGLPDPLMTAFGPVASAAWPDLIVTDAAMHEHDIRGGLDEPGARTSHAVVLALRSHIGLLRFVGGAFDLPPLVLQPPDGDREYRIGREEPQLALRANVFELFRATGGRRSLAQIAAMDWSADPGPWLNHLVVPSYTAPEDDLVE